MANSDLDHSSKKNMPELSNIHKPVSLRSPRRTKHEESDLITLMLMLIDFLCNFMNCEKECLYVGRNLARNLLNYK